MDDKRVQQIIASNRRILVGLAHYDLGKKQPGCDCCYCKPEEPKAQRED